MSSQGIWQFWIDRGGTFTDCVGRSPGGRVSVAKVLSSDRAPLVGIRRVLGLTPDAPIPPCEVRMGTTLATNALLERRGVACGLAISHGFGDLLVIADQSRPSLFDLRVRKPGMLYCDLLELAARIDARGQTLQRPEPEHAKAALAEMRQKGVRSLAVVLSHAYLPAGQQLEKTIGAWAREVGFEQVSLSHEVAAEIGMLGRGDTTVVDAYLTPLIREYVDAVLRELPGSSLHIMQSSGGLAESTRFRGRNAILSGPAGGVVACAHIARAMGLSQVIGFDMGGTSTDVSRYAGDFERVYETSVAGVRLRAPMMNIHTVAAGGGSICRFDGHKLTVGPDSAGSHPGPLCYGREAATELALTDINLALGRLLPDRFPFALDKSRALAALQGIAERLRATGDSRGPLGVAEGFLEIAVEHTSEAIRKVSIARGHDVRDHALVVFGGAGGQHACQIARRLEIRTIVFPPFSGVLSAYGMGVADIGWHGEADAGRFELDGSFEGRVEAIFEGLEQEGVAALRREGWEVGGLQYVRRVDLRYRGTETALTLAVPSPDTLRNRFERQHQSQFGYARPGHPVEVVTVRLEVVARSTDLDLAELAAGLEGTPSIESAGSEARATEARASDAGRSPMWIDGGFGDVPVLNREELMPGQRVRGPALVLEATATIVVEPGFELEMRPDRVIVVEQREQAAHKAAARKAATTESVDPVLLEVFNNQYMSIAEQMGEVLRRTALSTNIRERLDFSCAVFDKRGELVANAPHIPVHLGAMSESIRGVLSIHRNPEPGDVFATNDPALGGSHLPDITVVTPVFDPRGQLIFFAASRGHHADVGGITPGSIPAWSRTLDEEGVVLRALRIVHRGRLDEELLRSVFAQGPNPARDIEQNLADLQAQVAANQAGARMLDALVQRYGLEVVAAYMQHVQENAEAVVREAISQLPDGTFGFEDAMDDGTVIRVRLQIEGSRMRVDFSGTSAQVDGNLNAPRAVTVAAVLYVLRALVGRPIPLNAGCLRPVRVLIPSGSVLDPSPDAAVAAGNLETSQRVVDVLLAALGKLAACQGTMNNLTFGNSEFGYYETIAGGAGAGPDFDGASGVHTHMTNTRITDPEILESRFPVHLVRFQLRRGSGGNGAFSGGDGVIREIQALAPLQATILSERRTRPPFGLEGGSAGKCGHNTHNGRQIPGKAQVDLDPGESITIETPGGGGYGPPD